MLRLTGAEIEERARMRPNERQGSEMESERMEYPLQPRPSLTTVGVGYAGESAVRAVESIARIAPEAKEQAWFALLEAMQHERPARVLYCFFVKRALDVLLATLLIAVLSPLMLLACLLIWLDTRGAVIYRQRRIGRYGRPFMVYKFRTMIPDRRQTNQRYTGPERRRAHKTAADPRVTRTGRFMRRASIDELPQLFNVLRGQMSLVGPRPELPEIVATYETWQHARHLVLPGITGWWQTNGRSNRMMHENTELDIYYVKHISFILDVRILLGTLRAVAQRSGAF